ncbi:hypothetical protein MRX96_018740 [Rhipicephalus microplus]
MESAAFPDSASGEAAQRKVLLYAGGGHFSFTVLAVDPFEDSSRWDRHHSQLIGGVAGGMFLARSLRDRLDLLLAQFAARDRENLRRSGTEEEYNEKERLLAEVYHLAQNKKKIGEAIRDLGASEFEVTGREWMSVDEDVLSSHDEDNMWSTNVYDLGEAQASATCDDCEVLE